MRWAIGIDVGGTKIAGALVSEAGDIRGFEMNPVPAKGEQGVRAVEVEARRLLALAEAERCPIDGMGLAVPGAVDSDTGVVLWAPNLDWENLPLQERFEAAFEVPIRVELDVRATALGAMSSDLARDVRDFVYVTIGTGIGAGIVVNGDLHRGFHSCSGEIGHCVLVEDGPRCGCGQRGCLEALAAGSAIAGTARRIVDKTQIPSVLSERMDGNGEINPKHVFEAAAANDPLACEVVRTTAEYIGRGLSFLINILNPQKIIIGGGVAKGGEYLLRLIRQYAAEYTLHRGPRQTEIILSPDLDHLPVVGAANLVFKSKRRRRHE